MAGAPSWAEVALSVYELHGTSALNLFTSSAGIGGAYHVGVEVYGLEWSFGGNDVGTGVYMVHIGESGLGNFLSRVPLGKTTRSVEEVIEILDDLRKTWRGPHYHLLLKNCAHFSIEFTKRLGFKNQPEWVNALANTGAGLTGARDSSSVRAEEEHNLDEFDNDELEVFADDGDDVARLELCWRLGQEYMRDWVEAAKFDASYEDHLVEFRWPVPRGDDDLRFAATELMRDRRLRKAIAESVGSALGLSWDRKSEKNTCPVTVAKFQTLPGFLISATCRVKGGRNASRTQRKPKPELFANRFREGMRTAAQWPKASLPLFENMLVETTPGYPGVGKRVQTHSCKGGAISFPRKDFKAPDSVQGTLEKLERLRLTVAQQQGIHRTLGAMRRFGRETGTGPLRQ